MIVIYTIVSRTNWNLIKGELAMLQDYQVSVPDGEEERPADQRKKYIKPEIINEFDLETRAGSVIPSGVDPLDLDPW